MLLAPMVAASAAPESVRLEYELPARFEPEEMQALQDRWDIDSTNMEDRDDVGFVLQGEQTPFWLSKSVARGTYELDVDRDSLEIVNPASLLRQLTAHRAALTASIQPVE